MNGYRKCTITYRTTKYTSIYTHTHTRSLTQSHRIHTKPPNKQDWKGTWDESNSNGDEWLCFWNTETNLEVDGILSISQWQQQQQSEEKNCVILYSCKIILLVFLWSFFSFAHLWDSNRSIVCGCFANKMTRATQKMNRKCRTCINEFIIKRQSINYR